MKAGKRSRIFGDTLLRFSRCCRSEKVPVVFRRIADQQLAVERAVESHRLDEIGKGAGNRRRRCANRAGATPPSHTACTRMPSHFHSAA